LLSYAANLRRHAVSDWADIEAERSGLMERGIPAGLWSCPACGGWESKAARHHRVCGRCWAKGLREKRAEAKR
jgi:hypothetical protein